MLAYFCHTIPSLNCQRKVRMHSILSSNPVPANISFEISFGSTALTLNQGPVHAFFSFCGARQPGWISGYWMRYGARGERAKLAGARSQLELLLYIILRTRIDFGDDYCVTGTSPIIDKHTAGSQAYQLVVDLIFVAVASLTFSLSFNRPRHVSPEQSSVYSNRPRYCIGYGYFLRQDVTLPA